MPELPEVELVTRALDQLIGGRKIVAAELLRERLAPNTGSTQFSQLLMNASVNAVTRRGKHILFDLDNDNTLITHLRMSGRFLLLATDRTDPKFAHAIFYFEDGNRLVFQDQRHFGYMNIVRTENLLETREISRLAPEPLSEDFTDKYLWEIFRKKRNIKAILLDQSKVCGLGNIYASEALFRAGIHPAASTSRITKARIGKLFDSIRDTLGDAIDAGSTLNVDPENIDGSYDGGDFESKWRVYDREGENCFVCDSRILRLKQATRSSYFCPTCQRR